MKRFVVVVFFVAFAVVLAGMPIKSIAAPPPPPLPKVHFAAPPAVAVIPGTYVYLVPDLKVDVFFYGGFWFRLHEGVWFRAGGYNGPWVKIGAKKVPPPLLKLPPGYRDIPPGYAPIPYKDLRKNWRTWERKKHWDKPAPPPKGGPAPPPPAPAPAPAPAPKKNPPPPPPPRP